MANNIYSKNSEKKFSLQDKFLREQGTIILSGTQAIIRILMDQHRIDKNEGRNTASFVSGYRGSPLGGVDLTLERMTDLREEFQIEFIPGVNEDLAATAIYGSQFANYYSGGKYDGVVGMWYGKTPGVDRSGDAFRHANFAGVGEYGGVLAIAGDDPKSKSSTLPCHSEYALRDANMPILYPGNVQDILDLGLWGIALSRYSGLWVGVKIVTDVADGFGTAEIDPLRISIQIPSFEYEGKPWKATQSDFLLRPHSLDLEKNLIYGRLEAARQFARINPINRIKINPQNAWLGIISAGKNYYDIRHSLSRLGLDEEHLETLGIRLLKLGMIFPLEQNIIKNFSKELDQIWVIEEKRPFIEDQLKSLMFNWEETPAILGKKDLEGKVFIPADNELDADRLTPILYKKLKDKISLENLDGADELLHPTMLSQSTSQLISRTPYYCSGCPHNTSTINIPEGSLAGGGIGCHSMAITHPQTIGITQMGGEGAQWVGMAPFSEKPHLFQNIGDGTLFHSGSLSIRQAVAAGTNITYKILYNAAVGMTGGQHADGSIPVPDLTRLLEAQGVNHIIITSDDPEKYPANAQWANASKLDIWHRDDIIKAQEKLRAMPGVTVLIHDQTCAAELRRKRRRKQIEEPKMRVFINEAVCEGCGDCGKKSNCLSVVPVETEFGRKTQIHQASCNKDFSCLKGDCPAFVSVIPNSHSQKHSKPLPQISEGLPAPIYQFEHAAQIYMVGIGGTGVVTINQILGTAAVLEGKKVSALDQTGMSQKGGSVVSHLKIQPKALTSTSKITTAEADTYIAFDILEAAKSKHIKQAKPGKSIAIVSSSKVATGQMIKDTTTHFPQLASLKSQIDARTRKHYNFYLDAQSLSQHLFGSHMPANLILIGAAFQAGTIPLESSSIEKAIRLNGVAVEANIQAFRVGRKTVLDPEWREHLQPNREGAQEPTPVQLSYLDGKIDLKGLDEAPDSIQLLLAIRIPELIVYQNRAYAQKYVDFVSTVWEKEQQLSGKKTELTESVVRYLFKLMAYKDEYEVARLHLKSTADQAIRAVFGAKAKVSYLLHPPIFRAMGWEKKMKLGAWFRPFLRLLKNMKFMRFTAFDIFGYANVRRVERQLIEDYQALIHTHIQDINASNHAILVDMANLPDIIRGYEEVKMENVKLYREKLEVLSKKLEMVGDGLIK